MRKFPAGHHVCLEVECDVVGERLLSRESLCTEDPWGAGVRTGWGRGILQARWPEGRLEQWLRHQERKGPQDVNEAKNPSERLQNSSVSAHEWLCRGLGGPEAITNGQWEEDWVGEETCVRAKKEVRKRYLGISKVCAPGSQQVLEKHIDTSTSLASPAPPPIPQTHLE